MMDLGLMRTIPSLLYCLEWFAQGARPGFDARTVLLSGATDLSVLFLACYSLRSLLFLYSRRAGTAPRAGFVREYGHQFSRERNSPIQSDRSRPGDYSGLAVVRDHDNSQPVARP